MISKFLVVGLISYSTVGLGLWEIASATHLPTTQPPIQLAAKDGGDPQDPDARSDPDDGGNLVMELSTKVASKDGPPPSETEDNGKEALVI